MADNQKHDLIIVRRHYEEEHESHNTAWKVAHADFMTAMMAFFLIMWLINATDEEIKKSIANYFNPVHLSASVTNKKGLNDPEDVNPDGPKPDGEHKSTLTDEEGPHKKSGEDKSGAQEAADPHKAAAAADPHKTADAATAHGPASVAAAREQAAFQDPYAILAELAEEAEPLPMSPDAAVGETGVPGMAGGEVYRDPFDPVYWQMAPADVPRTETAGAPETAEPIPETGKPDAAAAPPAPDEQPVEAVEPAETMILRASLDGPTHPEAPSADPVEAEKKPAAEAADEMQPKAEPSKAPIAEEIEAELKESIGEGDVPQIEVRATDEGLLISLTDDIDFSMFDIGSAVPNPRVVLAMEEVAGVLAGRPGEIVIRGFTDGRPFRSDTYDNWRLSSARAHMAYYMLTRGGVAGERFQRIEGHADRHLKNPEDPNAAENRRIEILLLEPTA
jgi:chemotaxis protein MotB